MNNLIGRYAKMRPFLMGRTHFCVDSNSEYRKLLADEFVGGKVLGLRGLMNYLVMTVGVCVFFSQEVEVFLSALEVVGAEHERAVLDLGRIAPVLAVDDNLHALLDEFGLEVGVRGFVHENLRGVIRVGVRVLVTLLSGLSELLDQVG